MTRYVDKKHGLVIGSDNVFFYRDENDVLQQHFRAIVWCKRYTFDNISFANVMVRTPAEQVIWHYFTVEQTVTLGQRPRPRADHPEDLEERTIEMQVDLVEPSALARQWLNANTPGWGCRPPLEKDSNPTIFFEKRGHALAFVGWIEQTLEGMSFL